MSKRKEIDNLFRQWGMMVPRPVVEKGYEVGRVVGIREAASMPAHLRNPPYLRAHARKLKRRLKQANSPG